MNRTDFIQFIKQPSAIDTLKPEDITYLLNQYPYFQTAHLLFATYLSKNNDIQFHDQLKTAATNINDRSVLYWQIFAQNITSEQFLKPKDKILPLELIPDLANENVIPLDYKPKFEEKNTEEKIEPETIQCVHKIDLEIDEVRLKDTLESNQILNSEQTSNINHPDSFLLNLITKSISVNQKSTTVSQHTAKHSPETTKQPKDYSLIDKFLIEEPRISTPKRDFFNPVNMAENSNVDKEDIVTETLAKIYDSQGLYEKALKIYHKLYLVFPEKSTYFAAQIEILGKKLNK